MIHYYGLDRNDRTDETRQGMKEEATPVVPLPNPGEGGPVYSPEQGVSKPVIPLPNPGEGGPVFGGILKPAKPQNPGMMQPSPFIMLRFANMVSGYDPFSVYLNNRLFVGALSFQEITGYEQVVKGEYTISLVGPDGYIYLQKMIRIQGCRDITIAIVSNGSNLDLWELPENNCR